MGAFKQWAMNAADTVTGGAMGMILGGMNDKRQIKQQQKLTDMQLKAQSALNRDNQQLQLDMWEKTGYGAQMKQLKEAGLNPGLLYGMGGGGGQSTGSQGASVGGGQAPAGGKEVVDMMGMGIQRELLQAQKENIEADTANKIADAKNKPLQGKNIEASTGSLLQGIEGSKAQQAMTEVQTAMAEMTREIQGESMNNVRAVLKYELRRIYAQMESAEATGAIDKATKEAKIKMITEQSIGAGLQNALTQAKTSEAYKAIDVADAEIKKWTQELANAATTLDQNASKIAIEKFKADMDAKYPGLWNVIGGTVNGIQEEIMDKLRKIGMKQSEGYKVK